MGGCKSLQCDSVAKQIWDWAISKDIWLSAAHIPGLVDTEADNLSRSFNFTLEWMLPKHIFNSIVIHFGQPNIDLFASRLNVQITDYVSWKPDAQAKFIDAFSFEWSSFFFYAFPPFCLVTRCLQKIMHNKATGIIVVPLWTTQLFFTVVLSLLIDQPLILNVTQENLVHQTWEHPHPLKDQLQLLVCKLSGEHYRTQIFQKTSSWNLGGTPPPSNTATISTNGCRFVFKGHMIHCVQL